MLWAYRVIQLILNWIENCHLHLCWLLEWCYKLCLLLSLCFRLLRLNNRSIIFATLVLFWAHVFNSFELNKHWYLWPFWTSLAGVYCISLLFCTSTLQEHPFLPPRCVLTIEKNSSAWYFIQDAVLLIFLIKSRETSWNHYWLCCISTTEKLSSRDSYAIPFSFKLNIHYLVKCICY